MYKLKDFQDALTVLGAVLHVPVLKLRCPFPLIPDSICTSQTSKAKGDS